MRKHIELHTHCRATFKSLDQAKNLLEILQKEKDFKPEYFGALPPLKTRFTEKNLGKAASILAKSSNPDRLIRINELWMDKRRFPNLSYRLEWVDKESIPFSKPFFYIEKKYFDTNRKLESWMNFCWSMLSIFDAWFGSICTNEEWDDHNYLRYKKKRLPDFPEGYNVQHGAGNDLTKGIPGVYWGTYFGQFYVDWIGREKFDNLPCFEKWDLPTGGIFFTTAPTPFDWNNPETRTMQRAVMDHLGYDAFFDMQLLRKKLAAIGEPFDGNFDPRSLIPSYRVPDFPFIEKTKPWKTREEQIKNIRHYFEQNGFAFKSIDGDALTFHGEDGSITKIDLQQKNIEHYLDA